MCLAASLSSQPQAPGAQATAVCAESKKERFEQNTTFTKQPHHTSTVWGLGICRTIQRAVPVFSQLFLRGVLPVSKHER